MPSINVHGAGDSGGGAGGGSALNGVGQKIQDILNQLYNAGGSSGAFASASAQLSGISPGLAGMLGQSGGAGSAGGGGGGRAGGGTGGGGRISGPSSVNVNIRIADVGLGKMDGTLNKILDAIKAGNQAAAPGVAASRPSAAAGGPSAAQAPRFIDQIRATRPAAPFSQPFTAIPGTFAYEQRANAGVNRQRETAERASQRQSDQADRAAQRQKATQDRVAAQQAKQAASQQYRTMRVNADLENRAFDQARNQDHPLIQGWKLGRGVFSGGIEGMFGRGAAGAINGYTGGGGMLGAALGFRNGVLNGFGGIAGGGGGGRSRGGVGGGMYSDARGALGAYRGIRNAFRGFRGGGAAAGGGGYGGGGGGGRGLVPSAGDASFFSEGGAEAGMGLLEGIGVGAGALGGAEWGPLGMLAVGAVAFTGYEAIKQSAKVAKATQLANEYQAGMAGFAISGGFNQADWNTQTRVGGPAITAWQGQGIGAQQAAGMMQKYGILGNSPQDQQDIVTNMGKAQWMAGNAGLTQGQQFLGASLISQYGIGRPGVGGSQSAAILAQSQGLATLASNAGANGINRGALLDAINQAAGNAASVSMASPTSGSLAAVVSPFFNADMGAVQANNFAQQAIVGNAQYWGQAMGNPFDAYTTSVQVKNNQTAAQLKATLGDNSYNQLAKGNPELLKAYLQEAPKGSMEAGKLFTSIQQSYGGDENSPGYSDRMTSENLKALNVPDTLANRILYKARFNNESAAGAAIQIGGTAVSTSAGYTASQSIQYGTQYLAQIKSKHPNWTPEQVARAYNGGQMLKDTGKDYGSAFQTGFVKGNSDQALIQNALGAHATQAQITQFKSYIPTIRADASKYGVGADVIARIMNLESSGGTAQGVSNVMQVTGGAVQSVGGQVAGPTAGATPDTMGAAGGAVEPGNLDLQISELIQPLSSAADTILQATTSFAASATALAKALGSYKGVIGRGLGK